MSEFPSTRISLLMRIRDTADHAAWDEFASLYRPAIYRFARQRGLQEADAQDLAQNVLAAVADRITEWDPDKGPARFRTWLYRVARNQTITIFRHRKVDAARGGTTAVNLLQNQPEPAADLDQNVRREVFRYLARNVRAEFAEATWQAFYLTAVAGVSVQEAASSLGRSVGSIYTARSRIVRRLQELAKDFHDDLPHSPADCEAME